MHTTASNIAITGMGVVTPTATGIHELASALKEGISRFSVLELEHEGQLLKFPVAMKEGFDLREHVPTLRLPEGTITKAKRLRHVSTGGSFGVYAALEAWADAGLGENVPDPDRVAIVASGTNTQQDALQQVRDKYRGKLQFMNPNYGLSYLDTDIGGIISELLGIRGEAHVTGAASASGNMALIDGVRLIRSGEYDIVLVVAPLMELSIFEYQGFTVLGAMATAKEDVLPSAICRPFDSGHSGFVYGQCAGCVVLESLAHAEKRGRQVYGELAGYGITMDANRNPNPSVAGEQKAMEMAMKRAGVSPSQVDYVNTHGTASKLGDEMEAAAMLASGLEGVKANSTKSLTGHGLSAAGVIECIASLLQMRGGFLHAGRNIVHPITDRIDWIGEVARQASVKYIISNSFGFGGISTSIVLKDADG